MGGVVSPDRPDGERRRPAWLPWGAAVVAVPPLLAALGLVWQRPALEQDLTAHSYQALRAAGLTGATVVFDGRDARVSGVPAGTEHRVAEVLASVAGVRAVGVTAAPAAAVTVDVMLVGERFVVRGRVADPGAERAVLDAVAGSASGRPVA
ncbi:MAG TPA: hypothetical protein VGD67_19315, partial [Pseudonocardiaceae bacterium]